jgi:hypothetical protein
MTFEHAGDIEYSLFVRNLWMQDRSRGLIANAKSAKSKYLQFNNQERLFIQNHLQHRMKFLRNNQPLFLLAALFIGLVSSIFSKVLPIQDMSITAESIVKTTLFILVWVFFMQAKYVSMKKQTYKHLSWLQETNRSAAIDVINEDKTISMESESSPSY